MDPEPIYLFLKTIPLYVVIDSVVLLVLLFLSAMISGTEVAFFSLSKASLDALEKEKQSSGKLVFQLLDNPKKLLATILITNNFINILRVLLFSVLGEIFFAGLEQRIRFLIEVVLITFLILLFGEVLPKVYATRNSLGFSLFMS